MRQHSKVMAVCVALVAGGCSAAGQRGTNTQLAGVQCASVPDAEQQVTALLAPTNVERVEPLYRTEFRARAIQPRYVSGAKVYVPAQQGMSQGYLERVLSCHAAAQGEGHPNDPLRVANLRDVDVAPHGQRYVIEIEGRDRASGKAIWERARALRDGEVEVRQLSAAPTGDANL